MKTVRLRLPATSANLGPGFDAMALALELFLEIEATPAPSFSITATGRNQNICAGLNRNLLIQTYESVLAAQQRQVVPLEIHMRNGIPIGMGCGSSAAVRLAAVALASAFGHLDWDAAEDCRAGGADRRASGQRGGLLAWRPDDCGQCAAARHHLHSTARALARSAGPSRDAGGHRQGARDAAQELRAARRGREPAMRSLAHRCLCLREADLMRLATQDRLHQPYRMELCPLLPALLPLAGSHGVMSVTLSGAGPAVLLLTQEAEAEATEAAGSDSGACATGVSG